MLTPLQDRPRSSGIYGLFQLDGAPVAAVDAAALGLPMPPAAAPCWLAEGADVLAPDAVSRHEGPAGHTLLIGQLAGRHDLAARLGLHPDAPAALLAHEVLQRFGPETPGEMIGEWSLLHREHGGRLTLMLSAAIRDRIFFALAGRRLAVAPDLLILGRLDWIGMSIDEAGLMFALGRAQVRAGQRNHTMLKGVEQLEPGASVIVNGDGSIERYLCRVLTEQPRWGGTFADALAESDHLLRQIMRERMQQTARAAPMLSGGLDSSLLTWLCAAELEDNPVPIALTSVAPPGSGLSDEAEFADLVSGHLGLERRHVFPAPERNIYRPSDVRLGGSSGPITSNRHLLVDAFQAAANEAGATLLIDGTYGEMSVTARLGGATLLQKLRSAAGRILRPHRWWGEAGAAFSPFHARLAPHRLAALPEPITTALTVPYATSPAGSGGALFGYVSGIEKAMVLPTEPCQGMVRFDFPFRDVRLLRFFAGLPVRMLTEGGRDRGMARQMLAGHLPDAIRLRQRGRPASPDHLPRIQYQAASARARISAFRKAEVDDWLDLDWLDQTLAGVSARGAAHYGEANEVQMTAMAAEFLLWLRNNC